jgi:hypothetical protein
MPPHGRSTSARREQRVAICGPVRDRLGGGSPPPAAPPPDDFLLEWYKLTREPELELNKATLAYELELARLVVLLNGAAAGAFLTLTGAIWKEGARPAFVWVAGAIISWLIGLLAAAIATDRAYRAQREFTRAFRFRRQGEELRRIKGTTIGLGDLGIDSADPVSAATAARARAGLWTDMVAYFRNAAVFFFILGGVLALVAPTAWGNDRARGHHVR